MGLDLEEAFLLLNSIKRVKEHENAIEFYSYKKNDVQNGTGLTQLRDSQGNLIPVVPVNQDVVLEDMGK